MRKQHKFSKRTKVLRGAQIYLIVTVPELLASSSSVKMLLLPYWLSFRVVVVVAVMVVS